VTIVLFVIFAMSTVEIERVVLKIRQTFSALVAVYGAWQRYWLAPAATNGNVAGCPGANHAAQYAAFSLVLDHNSEEARICRSY